MRFVLLLIPSLFFSCSSELTKSNKGFLKKYRKDVQEIEKQRVPEKRSKFEMRYSTPPTAEEVRKEIAEKVEYYPYVDIAKLGDAPRNEYLPTRETYERGRADMANGLPANLFDLNYDLRLAPPFRVIGAEFDAIRVPKSDVFGVATYMNDKSYLLVGKNSLSKSLDEVNSQRTKTDVEISVMLVREKKEMERKKRMKGIFGSDVGLVDELAMEEKKPEDVAAKTTDASSSKSKMDGVIDNVSGFVRGVIKPSESSSQKK